MEIATTFEEVEDKGIGREVTQNPYIIAFTEKMMEMSNEIQKEWVDLEDIEEEFMPAIREFIYNMTGL